jgi:hypothetical protein
VLVGAPTGGIESVYKATNSALILIDHCARLRPKYRCDVTSRQAQERGREVPTASEPISDLSA